MLKKNKLSKKQIITKLKKKKLEDLELIDKLELILKRKRGFVIKVPLKNQPVILLVSGGLDSVIVWEYILSELDLQVFPLFIRRGQKRVSSEEKSVDFFSNYFKKKYEQKSREVQKVTAYIPPKEIRFDITKHSNKIINKNGQWLGIPVYTNLLFSYAAQFSSYLKHNKNINVSIVFSAFMPSDGIGMRDETLTSIRMVNLAICTLLNDFNFQIISLPIEKELGFYHEKEYFIRWATNKNLPLEKTNSCTEPGKHHCGKCIFCNSRKEAFAKAGVIDKTKYMSTKLKYRILLKLKKLFKRNEKFI